MMKPTTKILFAIFSISLIACNGPSLEKYYVENQDQKDFIVMSIPSSGLIADASTLSEKDRKTLNSIEKANILAFPVNNGNKTIYEKEKAELENILKDEKYKLLMKYGSEDGQFKLMYEGDPESIDEMIVFGSSDGTGFGVARILGNNMNPSDIMSLAKSLDSSNIDLEGIKDLHKIFDSKVAKDSLSIDDQISSD